MADITRRRTAPAGPYRSGEAVVEPDAAPAALKRISWGAIFAGVVLAMSLQLVLGLLGLGIGQIGRESCRQRVCQTVSISVVSVSFKTPKSIITHNYITY